MEGERTGAEHTHKRNGEKAVVGEMRRDCTRVRTRGSRQTPAGRGAIGWLAMCVECHRESSHWRDEWGLP